MTNEHNPEIDAGTTNAAFAAEAAYRAATNAKAHADSATASRDERTGDQAATERARQAACRAADAATEAAEKAKHHADAAHDCWHDAKHHRNIQAASLLLGRTAEASEAEYEAEAHDAAERAHAQATFAFASLAEASERLALLADDRALEASCADERD